MVGFVKKNRPDLAVSVAPAAPVAASVPAAGHLSQRRAAPAAAPAADQVVEKVLNVVAEKTGYPKDMLDLDLDLEADLGIDTVKQAETFAAIRESFAIPVQEGINLRDYPTLSSVVGFVAQKRPDLAVSAAVPAPAPVAAAARSLCAAAPVALPAAPAADTVVEQVLGVVADKTGYPKDMLELDLDMEADLGIDTVKQAETFAAIRETFAIPVQEGINLRDYPTLKSVVDFVKKMRPDLAVAVLWPPGRVTPAAAPAAPAPAPVPCSCHRRR